MKPWPSSRSILSQYLTTLALIEQQSHIDAKKSQGSMRLHRSYMGRPELCEFPTSTFSYAIILASVYEPYLIFLVSRTFYHVQ